MSEIANCLALILSALFAAEAALNLSAPGFVRRVYQRWTFPRGFYYVAGLALPEPPLPIFEKSMEAVAARVEKMVRPIVTARNFDKAFGDISRQLTHDKERRIRYIATFLLGIAGGAALIGQMNSGIYLVTASTASLLVLVVINAYSIMDEAGQMEKPNQSREQ